MVSALVQVYLVGAELLVLQVFGLGLQKSSISVDLALGAGEQHAPGATAARHGHTGSVFIGEDLMLPAIGRDDFHRAALVHAHAPLGDIEVVGAPIGHAAAAKFTVIAPIRKAVKAQVG